MIFTENFCQWEDDSSQSPSFSSNAPSKIESNRIPGFFCQKTNTFYEFTPEAYE